MRRFMLKSKIHRATITQADVNYQGSLTLDANLLKAADMVEFEEVHVWNVTRGSRFHTYAMVGDPGSGIVCVNGAAALLVQPGDLIIVATFTMLDAEELAGFKPTIVFVDGENTITEIKPEASGPTNSRM
jgi:aspartate 1-decarboxylase